MFKTVWIAGMPRSGSMWTFNVVRELARRAGFNVLPDKVFIHEAEWFAYANKEIAENHDPRTMFVLKTHDLLQALPPDHFIVSNIRDVRDAVMSFMRFMHLDFEKALELGKSNLARIDHYVGISDDRRMLVHYAEINRSPADLIKRLADRLALPCDATSAAEIASTFGKDKIKAQIQERDRRCQDAFVKGAPPIGEMMLSRSDGRYASIDLSTGFQSDHVSDYQDGDWRELLSEDQIVLMKEAFGPWIAKHGFAE
jgi:hypothetical protein